MDKSIKYLFLDIDGTLTDGKIYMSTSGECFKVFDVKDGYGIHDILPKAGIVPVVLTSRKSEIVVKRCLELNIRYLFQGCRDKETKMIEIANRFNIYHDEKNVYREIAYIGDDIVDIPCMRRCGIVGCPSDAVREVKQISTFVSSKCGGYGAVREFIEWLCNHNAQLGR